MVSEQTRPSQIPVATTILFVACTLLAAFVICVTHLRQDSLWTDETWTDWAIRTPFIRDTLERVRGDVHPPLYFLLLSGMGRLAGDSVLALRWPSALFGLMGLAATYALGKRLFDWRTGLIAVVVLATHSFFVYYTREARMYSLLLALAALATLLYWRWRQKPSLGRSVIYGISLTALLYTHYAGVLIVVTHIAHLLITIRSDKRAKWRLPLPYLAAIILFSPWLPTFLQQLQANPDGPLALPVMTDGKAVSALLLILTSGHWLLVTGPMILGFSIPNVVRDAKALLLLVLWLVVTPVVLLLLNGFVAPVYQVRYSIAILPAGALLVAYGLRHIKIPNSIRAVIHEKQFSTRNENTNRQDKAFEPQRRTGRGDQREFGVIFREGVLMLILLAWLAYTQLAMYSEFWAAKPGWETIIRTAAATRQPLEPIITDFAPSGPAAYYDRQLRLGRGVRLDLSWRLHSASEVHERTDIFAREASVWVGLPINSAKTWHIVSDLHETRHIGFRSALQNMIFYRFDAGDSNDLRFRFGEVVRYEGGMEADQQFAVQAGEALCTEITLRTMQPLDNAYSYGLHVVDWSGNIGVAQEDAGLGIHKANEEIALKPCLDIPAGAPAGHYHLELIVYDWSTVERLPVLEDGGGEALGWGDVLMLAAVDVIK